MKNCFNSRVQPFFHYFRDSYGNEVDLIIEQSGYTHAIEIRSAKTINDSFFKGLNYYAALSTKKIKSHYVYGGEEQYVYKGHHVLGWNKLTQLSIK